MFLFVLLIHICVYRLYLPSATQKIPTTTGKIICYVFSPSSGAAADSDFALLTFRRFIFCMKFSSKSLEVEKQEKMRNAYLNFKLHQSLWLERRTLIPTCLTFILQFSSIFLVGVNESGARRQVFL